MRSIFLILCLLTSPVLAETNYIFFASDGYPQNVGPTYTYDAKRDVLSLGGETMQGINWEIMEVDFTTDKLPAKFTNINQVVHTKILPMTKDQQVIADATVQITPVVQAIVDVFNKRLILLHQVEITDKELKDATTNRISTATTATP